MTIQTRRRRLSDNSWSGLVAQGKAQVVLPTTDVGNRAYGSGRLFTPDSLIPTMTSASAPSGVASASSIYGVNNAAWKAFNGAVAVQADSWFSEGPTGWLQYQFPAAHVVTHYTVNDGANFSMYAPKTWTFNGSNNGTDWTTLDTQTNITNWAPGGIAERKVFDFANANSYSYYRLDITESNHVSLVAVGELEMMETNLVFTDLVTISFAGAVAAGTNVAYFRNASATYYGPGVVTPVAKSGEWQTAAAALWHNPTALFGICSAGDLIIPLSGDSLAYLKMIGTSTFDDPTPQVIFDGNSLTIGHPYEEAGSLDATAPYPTQIKALLAGTWLFRNFGVDSLTTVSMSADAVTQIDPFYSVRRTHNIVVCWEGTNELYFETSAADAYAHIVTYCQARQAAGFKVIVGTILPRTHAGLPAGWEASRQTLNTNIRTNWATFADALADVAADSRIGDATDSNDTTYYGPDKVHMRKAGYGVVAGIVQTAIEGLL